MTIRGKEINVRAPVARVLAAQDLGGYVAMAFFTAYLVASLLAI